jgi:hypothetical protein
VTGGAPRHRGGWLDLNRYRLAAQTQSLFGGQHQEFACRRYPKDLILRDASQSKSAVADFDPSLTAEVGQARLRCDAPRDEVEGYGRVGFWLADDFARHSNPRTGGESHVRFVPEVGLAGAAETLWAVACFNSALLERAAAERGAVLSG